MNLIHIICAFLPLCAVAQPKYSDLQIIPLSNDSSTGTLQFKEKRANGADSFIVKAAANMAAPISLTLPDTAADGFLYYDSVSGLASFQPGGTGCLGCMDLTSNQTASGIKTFTNGIIMQGTSTVENLAMRASYAFTGGTNLLELNPTTLIFENGTPGQSRVQVGGFDGVGPVVSFGGRIRLYKIDGTTIKAGIGHGDSALWESINGYSVAGNTVINSAAAGTLTGLTIPTGAAAGYCWTSDAVGVGSWQTCGGGGSFITTGTNQTGLTGDKSTSGNWTFDSNILSGTTGAHFVGSQTNAFGTMVATNGVHEQVHIAYPGTTFGTFWNLYMPTANSFGVLSGGGQTELQIDVIGAGDTNWLMRGTLIPSNKTGNNGDIGRTSVGCGQCWRDGWFSGTITAPTLESTTVNLTAIGTITIGSGRMQMGGTSFAGRDSSGLINKVQLSWGGTGPGSIRSFDNAGIYQNSFEGTGIQTNIGYTVGPFGSPTTVITAAGNAIFPAIRMTTAPSAGYVLTSDASGNGSWQAPSGGSFITTNTNQVTLSGTKQTSGQWTFDGGVLVKLASTARDWNPEATNAYVLGTDTASWMEMYSRGYFIGNGAGLDLIELNATTLIMSNGTSGQYRNILGGFRGAGPVTNYGGRLDLFKIDGTTIKAGISHTDGALWESINGYSVGGTTIITSTRDVLANNVLATGFSATSGSFTGGIGVTGTAALAAVTSTSLTINTTTPAVIGQCWMATSTGGAGSWQTCGTGAFVTTNTNQSSLSGTKDWTSAHTFSGGFTVNTTVATFNGGAALSNNSTARQLVPQVDNTYDLGTTSLRWANVWSNYFGTRQGTFEVLNAAGTVSRAAMTQSGVVVSDTSGASKVFLSSSGGIAVNGTTALSLTCSAGQTVRQPQYIYGVLVSGTCAP